MRNHDEPTSQTAGRKAAVHFGFTVIEVLVVIVIVGFVSLMAAPFLSGGISRETLGTRAAAAMDALREAQSSAMNGLDNARWGVHFEATKFVSFKGAAYNPVDPNNVAHAFPDQVSITAVTLSPGGACAVSTGIGNCDVHFANRRGAPAESGSVVFTDDGGRVMTLTLNAEGMVDVN